MATASNDSIIEMLKKQNQALMARLSALEGQAKSTRVENESPKKSPRRSARKKSPKKRKSPSTHRTPRKQRKTTTPRKRTPADPQAARIRRLVGDTFKAKYDKQIRSGKFIDDNNRFKKDLFEDCVRPIIKAMLDDEDCDTTSFEYYDIFKMALSAVKKRGRYTSNTPVGCVDRCF